MNSVRRYLLALQFFTRIPATGPLTQWVGYNPQMLRASAGHFPGVGLLVGAVAALVYAVLATSLPDISWTPLVAAIISTIATVLMTGAFHEDGLADTADGLGGSAQRDRALEIMKDSRVGVYGVLAAVLSMLTKVALLALLGSVDWQLVSAAILAAQVIPRTWSLLLIRLLPHVGDTALSKSKPLADQISNAGLLTAFLWLILALVIVRSSLEVVALAACLGASGLAFLWMWKLLHRRLQGFTGDCLGAQSRVAVAVLSYSEYAHAWDRGGHHVDSVSPDRIDERIEHSHVLIVCNPNHPIGRTFEMQQLLAWHAVLARQGGWLIIEEAHADAGGTDSLAALSARLPRLIVFRSLGRFFGLAGARLRFVLAADPLLGRLREEPGPWYVSGPALKGAQATRQDTGGQCATRSRLAMDSKRLNSLLTRFDVAARGTALFQWWPHPCAAEMPHRLARHGMWVQLSSGPGCSSLRFGLPGSEDDWVRLERALLGDSMPSTRER